jgi:hypothetical protein
MLEQIKGNLKNIIGWKTRRRIVVFSIDDYGNVRIGSREALSNLEKAGLRLGRFDQIDALETRQDLEGMLETLASVKDMNGNHAVLTPFAVPCNIDYEKMAEDKYQVYYYEMLPKTFEKLAVKDPGEYGGAWKLWQEGIERGLLVPQFHGREHFNMKIFEEKLAKKDPELIASLKNNSNPGLNNMNYETIQYTAAFEFWDFADNERFKEIIVDGLNAFEAVFGYRSIHFNAPCGSQHHVIHETLRKNGIKYIDNPLVKKEHQGFGKYKTILNYTGKEDEDGLIYQVRNVVFEPTLYGGTNWVNYAMQQIATAFRWNRPAIISSHRANFCGHIEPGNRKQGLIYMKELLKRIKDKWPDVEFMSANQLGDLIASEE